jgi:hypothetical protein
MRIGIPFEKFQRIFPLKSPFLNPTENVSKEDPTYSVLLQTLEQVVADDSGFMTPNQDTEKIDLYFQAAENGSYISCIEYFQKRNDASPIRCFAIIIGEICMHTVNEEQMHIVPHFLLTGVVDTAKEVEVIIPNTLACRVLHGEFDNKPVMIECSTTNEAEISEALCYAEDCFKRILAGLSLDISVSQNWFEGSDEELDSRIEFITSRTEKQFRQKIESLRKQSLKADAALFIMSAPSGMQ